MNHSRWWAAVVVVVAMGLAACGTIPTAGPGPTHPTTSASPPASPSSPPTTTPPTPPTPSQDPSAGSGGVTVSQRPSPSKTSDQAPKGVVVTPAAVVHRCMADPDRDECPDKPVVYLTVDDGPSPESTNNYLAILAKHGIAATFFVTGQQASQFPGLVQKIFAQGSGIGVHTWSHDYSVLYPDRVADPKRIGDEIDRTLGTLRDALGPDFTTTAFRYPGGHMSWKGMGPADKAVAARGMAWLDWNAMYGDAEPESRRPTTVEDMVNMVTSGAENSGNNTVVVLLHEGPTRKLSQQATPAVIAWFRDHGYRFGVIR